MGFARLGSDSTILGLQYDPRGNTTQVNERNGDQLIMTYDGLSRVSSVGRIQSGVPPFQWQQANVYDANSNRIALQTLPLTGAVYGTATFGTSVYGGPSVFWQLPSGGYNSHNLPPGFMDGSGNLTSFEYDIEDRRTLIAFPFPAATPLQIAASYDIMGRLLGLAATYNGPRKLDKVSR